MSYEWNPYFQYLSNRFTSKDIRKMRRRAGQMNRAQKNKQPKITNGDRIRSMTDAELACFFCLDVCIPCVHCEFGDRMCSPSLPCSDQFKAGVFYEWLQKEWKPGRWKCE